MIMKFQWEESDIKGGTKLRRLEEEPCMIGYILSESSKCKYVLIDLRDGAVMKKYDKSELVAVLNVCRYEPDTWPILS
jgi:hypothetical protein